MPRRFIESCLELGWVPSAWREEARKDLAKLREIERDARAIEDADRRFHEAASGLDMLEPLADLGVATVKLRETLGLSAPVERGETEVARVDAAVATAS